MGLSKKTKDRIKRNKIFKSYSKLLTRPIEYNPFKVGDTLECHTIYPFGSHSRWDLFIPGNKYVVSNTIGGVVYIDDLDGDPCEFYIHPRGLDILSRVFNIDHYLRDIRLKEINGEIKLGDKYTNGCNPYIIE